MKTYVVALVVVVAVLGGFYGGYKVGQNNVSANTSTPGARTNTGSGAGAGAFTGGRGAGAVCPSPGATPAATGSVSVARGTVANLGGTSMTVTNTSCDVKVTFGPTVTISRQALGTTSDLQDNQTVTITGTRQADGSILAQTIQIGPAGGGGGIRPGAGGGTTGTPAGG
jgi:hypothetical protein